MVDMRAVCRNRYGNNIEANRHLPEPGADEVTLCNPAYLPLFGRRDRLFREAKTLTAPGLYFNEDASLTILRYYINFSQLIPVVSRNYSIISRF